MPQKKSASVSLKSTGLPSHSLSISQTRNLHEWFHWLPAIILPSLQQCFLKYACPTFPHHLPNSNGCPLLLPLFSSASSLLLSLLPATPLYLQLTQFPGLIHTADFRQTVEQQIDWQTDRHKGHTNKLARMPLLCPLLCPPTSFLREWTHHSPPPSEKRSSDSLFLWPQTRAHTHSHISTYTNPPALTQTHLLFGLKREKWRLIYCLADML